MSAANKAKGSRFENEFVDWLLTHKVDAQRLPRAGSKDIGDAVVRLKTGDAAPIHLVIEAKNEKSINLPGYLKEADIEAEHYSEKFDVYSTPVVVVKRRGKGADGAYIVMEAEEWLIFLRVLGLL